MSYQQVQHPRVERLEAGEARSEVPEQPDEHLDGRVMGILLEPPAEKKGLNISRCRKNNRLQKKKKCIYMYIVPVPDGCQVGLHYFVVQVQLGVQFAQVGMHGGDQHPDTGLPVGHFESPLIGEHKHLESCWKN